MPSNDKLNWLERALGAAMVDALQGDFAACAELSTLVKIEMVDGAPAVRFASSAIEPTLPTEILALCRARGWNLHWTHRGAYLHLEASELIEALRGKRGDPLHEAADVLLVLMSITENAGLPWSAVMQQARATCEELKTRPRYPGEEFESQGG